VTERRKLRNSRDSMLQGDGWRWSLSFYLPHPLCMLVLTAAQREACWAEWEATQQEFARRGLVSMDALPPEGNSGSGPPQDYDG
jgi:hypothetical protein